MPRSRPDCSSRCGPSKATSPPCSASSRWATLAAAAATLTSASGSGSAVRTSIPSPLTTFVGRTAERTALADALQAHRLVTAIGPGGVGKTRLALAVAADVSNQFADGAWFVDLVPVTDPAMVAPAIAAALGLGEHQARSAEDTVRGWLAARQTLLVLDNCEHLLDGVVAVVERLLASSAQNRSRPSRRAGVSGARAHVDPAVTG